MLSGDDGVSLEHVAEWAAWEGRDAGLSGEALYLHIRAAYPHERPWRGGCSRMWSRWLLLARERSGAPSPRERLAMWVAREVSRDGWQAVADRLGVDVARCRAWVHGAGDVRMDRAVRAWMEEVCGGE